MQSKAKTVEQYLKELPPDRREAIAAVREVILKNIDSQYEEGMQYGMIGYFVPHRIYPAGYHCDPRQPLPYVCLASQKNHMSVYLTCDYGDEAGGKWFRAEWAKTGKKLDMGKSCIRFRKVEDLALNVIGEAIRRTPVDVYVQRYESVLASTAAAKHKSTPKKKAAKKSKAIAKGSAANKAVSKKSAKAVAKKKTKAPVRKTGSQ